MGQKEPPELDSGFLEPFLLTHSPASAERTGRGPPGGEQVGRELLADRAGLGEPAMANGWPLAWTAHGLESTPKCGKNRD